MIQEKINTKALYDAYDECRRYDGASKSTNRFTVKQHSFHGSWTAGQVMEHVTKSNTGIAKALNIEGMAVGRNADAREPELREMFLDFSVKFQSPDFILPVRAHYEPKQVKKIFKIR